MAFYFALLLYFSPVYTLSTILVNTYHQFFQKNPEVSALRNDDGACEPIVSADCCSYIGLIGVAAYRYRLAVTP